MGRAPCCSKVGLHRGPWTAREDALLTKYIQVHGEGNWRSLPKKAGLLRCGKSCRLRWMNYLRPDIKRGNITPDEDDIIIKMHALLGNRWSLIAGRLPGRTDNEIKNYWNTHLSKKLRSQGTDPNTHKKLSGPQFQEPTKKNRNSNKRQKNKPKSKVESEEKQKVHNPKPIRIKSLTYFPISRNSRFDWTPTITTTTTTTTSVTEVVDHDVPWTSGVVGLLVGDGDQDDHDRGNGLDFEFGPYLPITDNTLEKLYEEYLHLLENKDHDQAELDSFAQSLLI